MVKRKVINRFLKERGYQLVGTFKKFEGTDKYFALVEKENKQHYIDLNGQEFNSFSDVLKHINIDSINRVKKTSELAITDNEVFSIPSEDVSYSEKWKSRSFKTYIQNGKTGCVFLNDTILSAKFDQILITYFRNNEFLLLKKGDFVGVSNTKGEIVVPIEYNEVNLLQKPTKLFTFSAIKGEKTGVISSNGSITVPFEYPSNATYWKNLNDFLVIEKKQNGVSVFGIIDGTGKFLIPVIYKEISMFDATHFLVSIEKNGKRYGLINLQGKILSGTDNYQIKKHINNLCIITNYSIKSGLLDLNTDQLIIPCEYNFEFISGTKYIEYSKSDNGQPIRGILNAKGKIMFESSFQSLFFNTNNRLFLAKKGGKYGVVDTTGKIKIPFEYDKIDFLRPSNCYNGSLFSFKLSEKKGIINENAEILIPAVYDDLSMGEFSVIYKIGIESGVMTLEQNKMLTIKGGIIRGETDGIVRWQDSEKRKFKSDFYNHTIENIE